MKIDYLTRLLFVGFVFLMQVSIYKCYASSYETNEKITSPVELPIPSAPLVSHDSFDDVLEEESGAPAPEVSAEYGGIASKVKNLVEEINWAKILNEEVIKFDTSSLSDLNRLSLQMRRKNLVAGRTLSSFSDAFQDFLKGKFSVSNILSRSTQIPFNILEIKNENTNTLNVSIVGSGGSERENEEKIISAISAGETKLFYLDLYTLYDTYSVKGRCNLLQKDTLSEVSIKEQHVSIIFKSHMFSTKAVKVLF